MTSAGRTVISMDERDDLATQVFGGHAKRKQQESTVVAEKRLKDKVCTLPYLFLGNRAVSAADASSRMSYHTSATAATTNAESVVLRIAWCSFGAAM